MYLNWPNWAYWDGAYCWETAGADCSSKLTAWINDCSSDITASGTGWSAIILSIKQQKWICIQHVILKISISYMTCIYLGELFTTIKIFVHRILHMHININITNIQSRLISHHYIRIVSHFFLFQLIFLTWTKGVPFIKTPL